MALSFKKLPSQIHGCHKCERLRNYCQEVARTKRKAYLKDDYWGKPVAGFGDAKARVWIVGLAPAAHGANRTGRIFTGDRSGEWLYRALHKAGFANQAMSTHIEDGLQLRDAYISCIVRCAPPDNKPLPEEKENCLPFLREELGALHAQLRVVVLLGAYAYEAFWKVLGEAYKGLPPRPKFGHGVEVPLPEIGLTLLLSYHPSQQNTFTGKLTERMFDEVFNRAKVLLEPQNRGMQAISEAIQCLAQKDSQDEIGREEIMAYSLLTALVEHWPAQQSPEIATLLHEWRKITELEHSRFIKQRRIALAMLARELRP